MSSSVQDMIASIRYNTGLRLSKRRKGGLEDSGFPKDLASADKWTRPKVSPQAYQAARKKILQSARLQKRRERIFWVVAFLIALAGTAVAFYFLGVWF